MSIEDTLKERITQMSADVQGGPSLQRAIQQGRTRRRRRAVARVGSGVASVCAVGVVAGGVFAGLGPFDDSAPDERDQEWSLATAPEDVPAAIDRVVRDQLPDTVQITHREVQVFGKGDKPLPPQRWEHGTGWSTTYMLGSGESLTVWMGHAAGETEAPSKRICRDDVRHGWYLSCDFKLRNGVELFVREGAARNDGRPGAKTPGPWRALLPAGKSKPGNPDIADVDPDRIWFSRDVEAQPGGDYLVSVSDSVHAPDHEKAKQAWTLDADDLSEIVLNDELLEDPADD